MLFCVLFVFCSRSDKFWAVSNWSPDCLGQLLFWLRLSFLVIWWLLLKFVLPGSVYLFLYFSYLTVTSFLLPSGMLLLIHYKFLPPSFVFLLHFHICFSSFISSVFFWYRNCSVFSNFWCWPCMHMYCCSAGYSVETCSSVVFNIWSKTIFGRTHIVLLF